MTTITKHTQTGQSCLRTNTTYVQDAQRFHTRQPAASHIEMNALQQVTTAYSGEFRLVDIREQVSDKGIRIGLANGVLALGLRQRSLNNESVLWNVFGDSTQDAKDQTKVALGLDRGYRPSSSTNEKPASLDNRPEANHLESKPVIERFNSNRELVKMKVGFSAALNLGPKQHQKLAHQIYWERA